MFASVRLCHLTPQLRGLIACGDICRHFTQANLIFTPLFANIFDKWQQKRTAISVSPTEKFQASLSLAFLPLCFFLCESFPLRDTQEPP